MHKSTTGACHRTDPDVRRLKEHLSAKHARLSSVSFDDIAGNISLMVRHCRDIIRLHWQQCSSKSRGEYIAGLLAMFRKREAAVNRPSVDTSPEMRGSHSGHAVDSGLSVARAAGTSTPLAAQPSSPRPSIFSCRPSLGLETTTVSESISFVLDTSIVTIYDSVPEVRTRTRIAKEIVGSSSLAVGPAVSSIPGDWWSGGWWSESDGYVLRRKPETLRSDDHRFWSTDPGWKRSRTFFCDLCGQPFAKRSDSVPFWGGYVCKTWLRKTSVQQLYDSWEERVIDLTWHCVPCHSKKVGSSERRAAGELGVYEFTQARLSRKRDRAAHWR